MIWRVILFCWLGANLALASLPRPSLGATTSGLPLGNGVNLFVPVARDAAGTMVFSTVDRQVLPATVTPSYDADGNLASDGYRAFAYDDADELTSVTVPGAWKSDFVYDALGRRRIGRDYAWRGGGWTLTNETHYICDGMQVLQERNAANTVLVTYTRGLDLGSSRQGAGGIGGLLARTDGSGSTYYHADAAGNITAMADASGNVVARYLYDPFGNLLGKWGALADANRYRFSSKEVHPNSGLYYYGYRFYEPNLQRWMNRDPIGEAGGINLYRAVLNAPGNVFDSDGLSTGNFYAGSSPGFNPSYGVDNAPVNMVFTMNINRGANGNVNFLSDASYDYAGTDPMAVFALQTELMNPITGPLLAAVAVQQGYKDATNPNLDPLTRTGGACTALGNGIMLGLGAKASLGKCLGTMAAEGADAEVGALATKCSPAGTKVSTPDGDVNIEDIKVGDTVYGCDLETGETVERKVTELLRNSTYHWVDVQVGSEMIRATRSHPFWVENKHDWVEAANLRVGMVVRLESGQPVAITSVSIVDLQQPQPTYNLEVAVDHDYFVSGLHVLVHNGDGSYTITFASGKQYVGKGDLSRMADSAARISAQTGDPVVNTQ